jgi:hypothetical protein
MSDSETDDMPEPCELFGGPLDGAIYPATLGNYGIFLPRVDSRIGHAYRRCLFGPFFEYVGLLDLRRFERRDWTTATPEDCKADREKYMIVEAEAMRLIREERRRAREMRRKKRE